MTARIKERRRRQRVDVVLPIKIKYNRKEILTKTKNISILGTYLETGKEIPIGATLDISLSIPRTGLIKIDKKSQINCTGVAFRCQSTGALEPKKQYGIGIFFRSFSEGDEKNLSKYIDYILVQEKRKGKILVHRRQRKQPKRKGEKW